MDFDYKKSRLKHISSRHRLIRPPRASHSGLIIRGNFMYCSMLMKVQRKMALLNGELIHSMFTVPKCDRRGNSLNGGFTVCCYLLLPTLISDPRIKKSFAADLQRIKRRMFLSFQGINILLLFAASAHAGQCLLIVVRLVIVVGTVNFGLLM